MAASASSSPRRIPSLFGAITLLVITVASFYIGGLWSSNLGFQADLLRRQSCTIAEFRPFNGSFRISANESFDIDVFDERNRRKDWGEGRFRLELCSPSMKDYVPCRDNVDVISRLSSVERGEAFERYCPPEEQIWFCLVPNPKKYRRPIPWPASRDEVWYSNIPSKRLLLENGSERWIVLDKDKFRFLQAGIHFIGQENQYLQQLNQMVPALDFGSRVRVILDVGSSLLGTSLLPKGVITLTVGPKDSPGNRIQLSLERGLPAMIAAFAIRRLPFPSQAFDLIHCLHCSINWTRDGGILLLEANRLLRGGGYFVWGPQSDMEYKGNIKEMLKDIKDLTNRICWNLLGENENISVWQKASDNSCYLTWDSMVQPPVCEMHDDPNDAWYVPLKACITRLLKNGSETKWLDWPKRLRVPPNSLHVMENEAYISKVELFNAEGKYWKTFVKNYMDALNWKKLKIRNVMDMKANFGGFAAALVDEQVDCWVMNVVPVSTPNTLPVIFERGLIGVAHDWCEPFDTYPRTYDLVHASGLFSIEKSRCALAYIILEMDRILRPGGHAYIEDSLATLLEIEAMAKSVGWRTVILDIEDGVYGKRSVLYCQKQYLHN